MRIPKLAGTTLLLISVLLAPLSGQNVGLDQGTFRISLNGKQVGQEEFSISRVGMGAQARVILRGSVDLSTDSGELSLAPAMDARGPELAVATYQIKVSGSETTEIYVGLNGSRFQARVISAQGEQLREFRAGPGSVLLDQFVAHQNYLLTPHLDENATVSLNILTPRESRQVRMNLTFVGADEVRVGNSLYPCRHFRLEGGEGARDIWFDDQGRVLKVEIPSLGYLAERDAVS
jgi:hypothetical protein